MSLPQQISAAPPVPPAPAPIAAPHFAAPPIAGPQVAPQPASQYAPPAPPTYYPPQQYAPQQYAHTGHPSLQGPHFSVSVAPQRTVSNSAFAAQVIAFIGVLGLTLGTFVLLYTHFLATDTDALLAPGWVVAAVSQLVLLLGVVMLVSAGLNQTSREVAWRVESLGERLNRIEYASQSGSSDERHDSA